MKPNAFCCAAIVAVLLAGVPAALSQAVKTRPAVPAGVNVLPKVGLIGFGDAESVPVEVGMKPFTDSDAVLESVAPELVGLSTVRMPKGSAPKLGTTADTQLLVGFFKGQGGEWAKPPQGKEPVIKNAAKLAGMPEVDVYVVPFKKTNAKTGGPLNVGSPGAYILLGAIPSEVKVTVRDAKGGESK